MATSRSQEPICSLVEDRTLVLETEAGLKPDYYGVVVTEDTLLVTDYSACNLQIYSLHDGKLYTSHRLKSRPMDVCLISKTEVAVCLVDSKIVILSFESVDDVKLVKTLYVRRGFYGCYSVAKWNSDKLVVSGWNKYDDWMLCWGVVSITDGRRHSTQNICRGNGSTSHLAIKDNTVYISCWTFDPITNGVYAYDISNPHIRKFLYQHEELNPWRIMADRDCVYVTDYHSNRIHQLTDSGQLVTIHTVSSKLLGIFYDDQHGVLYTTRVTSDEITVYKMEYPHQTGIPTEILNMDSRSIQLFEEALKDGKETVYNIRIMVVGHMGVGKTTLVKRLLGEKVNISDRHNTEGIDVYVNCCDVSLSTHEWTRREKDSEQDYKLQRLVKVLNENYQTGKRVVDMEQDANSNQRERANGNPMSHVPDDDNNAEVIYQRSQQQNLGHNLSSTSSLQEASLSTVVERNLTQSETNSMSGSEPGEKFATESDRTDPLWEMLKLLQQNPDKAKQDVIKYAHLTVLDFAGQYAFYTTHQLFLSRRAIYLLVSDASRDVIDHVEDDCYFDSEGIMKCKVHDLVDIWMNSIHSCAEPDMANLNSANSHTSSYKVIPPPVILVGTHIDQIPQNLPGKVGNYGGQSIMPGFPDAKNPGSRTPIQYDVQAQRNQPISFDNYGGHIVRPGFPGGNNTGPRNPILYDVQTQWNQPSNYGGQSVMPFYPYGNNPGPRHPIPYNVQAQQNQQSMIGNFGGQITMPGFPGGNNPGSRHLMQYDGQTQWNQLSTFDNYRGHIVRPDFPDGNNTGPRNPILYDVQTQMNQPSNYGGQSVMPFYPYGNNPGPRHPIPYNVQAQQNQPSMVGNFGGQITMPGFPGGNNPGSRHLMQYDGQTQWNQLSTFDNYRGHIVRPDFPDGNNTGPRNPIQYDVQTQMNQPSNFGNYGGQIVMPFYPYGNNSGPRNPIPYNVQAQQNHLSMVGTYGDHIAMPGFPYGNILGPRNPIQYDVQAQLNQPSMVGNYGGHIVRPGFPGSTNTGSTNPIQYSQRSQPRMAGNYGGLIVRPVFPGDNNPVLKNSIESNESDEQAPRDYCRERGQRYLMDIRSYLKDKPTAVHLVDEDFAIDNTVLDSKLEELKRKIVEVASQQPFWGEQIPTRWFVLEQHLMRLRDAGVKVISHSAVEDLNKEGTVRIEESEELDLFLRYLHETGTIIYFSIEVLRDNIVLDPNWLIDALKSLISAQPNRPNCPDGNGTESNSPADSTACNDITQKWSDFKEKGILTVELVDVIWNKEKHPELHAHRNHILLIMEQLNIIAKPRSFNEIGEKEENYFLTPCMLRQESPKEVISPDQDPQIVSTPLLRCVFTEKFLPSPVFHRLLAACVARWPVAKKKETSENLIFCGCCVFEIDLFHRLTLHCRKHIVFARISRMVIDGVKIPDAKLCTRVRKFITLNLSKITSYLTQNLQYELHVCPPFQMWLADEGHDPDAPITPEHMNHARLCVALVTVCGKALREILLTYFPVPYKDIYQVILANRYNLVKRKGRPLLNPDQSLLVFPEPLKNKVGTVDKFDLSILYTLIRNISTVPAPKTGWDLDPYDQPRDTSLGASVERIRSYRNCISGHTADGMISQQDFEDYWNKFEAVLHDIETVIGGQAYSQELKKQRRQVISVYEAC